MRGMKKGMKKTGTNAAKKMNNARRVTGVAKKPSRGMKKK